MSELETLKLEEKVALIRDAASARSVLLVLAGLNGAAFLGVYVWAHLLPQNQLATELTTAFANRSAGEVFCYAQLRLALSVSRDLLGLRFLATTLGASLAFIGCLFVLTGIKESFRLGGSSGTGKLALATSSPGLVLIALGVALPIVALLRTQSMNLQLPDACSAGIAAGGSGLHMVGLQPTSGVVAPGPSVDDAFNLYLQRKNGGTQ